MLGTWPDDCRTGGERTKLSFWCTKFLDNYSVNLNFSNNYSLLSCSHLTRYQASLYLKTNLPVCLFTHSKGIKIGPPCEELRGVSKLPRTLKHPVGWVNLPPKPDVARITPAPVVSQNLMSLPWPDETHRDVGPETWGVWLTEIDFAIIRWGKV